MKMPINKSSLSSLYPPYIIKPNVCLDRSRSFLSFLVFNLLCVVLSTCELSSLQASLAFLSLRFPSAQDDSWPSAVAQHIPR